MVSVDIGCDRELEVPVVSVDIGCDRELEVPVVSVDVGCDRELEVPVVSVDVGCDRELEVPVVSVDIGCDDVGCEGRMCEWVWGQSSHALSYQQALPKFWFVSCIDQLAYNWR